MRFLLTRLGLAALGILAGLLLFEGAMRAAGGPQRAVARSNDIPLVEPAQIPAYQMR